MFTYTQMSLSEIFKKASLISPTTEEKIQELENQLGKKFPQPYKDLLLFSNGIVGMAEFEGAEIFAKFWPLEKLIEGNSHYKAQESIPGLFLIGSDGGGELFCIDFREDSQTKNHFLAVPAFPMELKYANDLGETIESLVKNFLPPKKEPSSSTTANQPQNTRPQIPLNPAIPQPPKPTSPQTQTPSIPQRIPIRFRYPSVHFTKSQEIIENLEKLLDTKIIVYFVPQTDSISDDHPDYFLELLRKIKHQAKITLVLCSFGGDPMASIRIAHLLRDYCNTLEIVIPAESTSAATQLALSADKILYTSIGYLGPIDAQIIGIRDQKMLDFGRSRVSFDSFRRAHEMIKTESGPAAAYEKLFNYIPPLVVAEIDKLSSRSKKTAISMMKLHPHSFDNDEAKMEGIADKLVYGYPVHNYPILFEEARSLGLPVEKVSEDVSLLLWDLVKYLRSDTKESGTYINPIITHVEAISIIIESLNRRVIKRTAFDFRYFEAEKRWRQDRYTTEWKKLVKTDDPEKPLKYISIEGSEEEVKTQSSASEKTGTP